MTKLGELKAALNAAYDAWDAAWADEHDAAIMAGAAYEAYDAELKKTKEQANGGTK